MNVGKGYIRPVELLVWATRVRWFLKRMRRKPVTINCWLLLTESLDFSSVTPCCRRSHDRLAIGSIKAGWTVVPPGAINTLHQRKGGHDLDSIRALGRPCMDAMTKTHVSSSPMLHKHTAEDVRVSVSAGLGRLFPGRGWSLGGHVRGGDADRHARSIMYGCPMCPLRARGLLQRVRLLSYVVLLRYLSVRRRHWLGKHGVGGR